MKFRPYHLLVKGKKFWLSLLHIDISLNLACLYGRKSLSKQLGMVALLEGSEDQSKERDLQLAATPLRRL